MMLVDCRRCGTAVPRPPEPADRVLVDGFVKVLVFLDAEAMEDHARHEKCAACGWAVAAEGGGEWLVRPATPDPFPSRASSAAGSSSGFFRASSGGASTSSGIGRSSTSSSTNLTPSPTPSTSSGTSHHERFEKPKRGWPKGRARKSRQSAPDSLASSSSSSKSASSPSIPPKPSGSRNSNNNVPTVRNKNVSPDRTPTPPTTPAKRRRGRPPGSKNKPKPGTPTTEPERFSTAPGSPPPLFVYGPTLDGLDRAAAAEPTVELTESQTLFAATALRDPKTKVYPTATAAAGTGIGGNNCNKSGRLAQRLVVGSSVPLPSSSPGTPDVMRTRADRRRFTATKLGHLVQPGYDPEADVPAPPPPRGTGPTPLPPCGNDFDVLGCVCQGWVGDPDDMYEEHCGRADCVLGCVCGADGEEETTTAATAAAGSSSETVRRREKTVIGIVARDVGPDEAEEMCVAVGRRLSVGEDPRRPKNDKDKEKDKHMGKAKLKRGRPRKVGSEDDRRVDGGGKRIRTKAEEKTVGEEKAITRAVRSLSSSSSSGKEDEPAPKRRGRPPKNKAARNPFHIGRTRTSSGEVEWIYPKSGSAANRTAGNPADVPKGGGGGHGPGLGGGGRRVGKTPARLRDFVVEFDDADVTGLLPHQIADMSEDIIVESFSEDEDENMVVDFVAGNGAPKQQQHPPPSSAIPVHSDAPVGVSSATPLMPVPSSTQRPTVASVVGRPSPSPGHGGGGGAPVASARPEVRLRTAAAAASTKGGGGEGGPRLYSRRFTVGASVPEFDRKTLGDSNRPSVSPLPAKIKEENVFMLENRAPVAVGTIRMGVDHVPIINDDAVAWTLAAAARTVAAGIESPDPKSCSASQFPSISPASSSGLSSDDGRDGRNGASVSPSGDLLPSASFADPDSGVTSDASNDGDCDNDDDDDDEAEVEVDVPFVSAPRMTGMRGINNDGGGCVAEAPREEEVEEVIVVDSGGGGLLTDSDVAAWLLSSPAPVDSTEREIWANFDSTLDYFSSDVLRDCGGLLS